MKILAFPKSQNPYQELLYKPMRKNVDVVYLEPFTNSHTVQMLTLPLSLLIERLKGFSIFHLHWTYPFKNPIINNDFIRLLYSLYFGFFMLFTKIIGFKLVWTVHNVLPHQKRFYNDLLMRKFLSKMSNLKIVHSESVIKDLQKLQISTEHTKVIPLGNYIDIYENNINKSDARKKLGIIDNELVFLLFGQIERYKGTVELIETFKKMTLPGATLLIVGNCRDSTLKKEIVSATTGLENVRVNLEFIPNNEIQTYLNACDIVVNPFTRVTTSSSVILAFSFKKPVIAPKIGVLKDIPENLGYFYSNEDPQSLGNALSQSYREKSSLEDLGLKSYTYVKNFNWENISKSTIEAMEAL